jgi:hypothetical protein
MIVVLGHLVGDVEPVAQSCIGIKCIDRLGYGIG